MTDTNALLPCPVCGGAPRWRGSPTDYRAGIFRLQCLGETHLFQSYGATEVKAITAWNTRATDEHPSATDWQNRAERAEQECAEIEARVTGEIEAWLRRDDFNATADALARGDHKESQP